MTDGLGYLLRARLNGTCLDLRRNWGEYPAIKLKLYIQDVEAALNTLHLQETCPIIGYGRVLYCNPSSASHLPYHMILSIDQEFPRVGLVQRVVSCEQSHTGDGEFTRH